MSTRYLHAFVATILWVGCAVESPQKPVEIGVPPYSPSGTVPFTERASRPETAEGQWRVLPIRTEVEAQSGEVGGEGIQLLHGIARSASNPDVIYLSHDAGPTWVSLNNGRDWIARRGKGLPFATGNSIAVDPANAKVVYKVVSSSWKNLPAHEGLYKSTDGGDTWQPALLQPTNYTPATRMTKYNIAIDPHSVSNGQAQKLYVAFQGNGLFRTADAGNTWVKVADLKSHQTVFSVTLHPDPTNEQVYVASSRGAFVGLRGRDLKKLESLPANASVSSLVIRPDDAQVIYATVLAEQQPGLWRSTNGGVSFDTVMVDQAYSRVHMNPGFPDSLVLIGLANNTYSQVSKDGGASWEKIAKVEPGPQPWRNFGTWHEMINSHITALTFDPRTPYGAIANSKAFMIKTTDLVQWSDSSRLFTGASAPWVPGSVKFTQDPNELYLFCHDIGALITRNNGAWFEWLGHGTSTLFNQGKLIHGSVLSASLHPTNPKVIIATAGHVFDVKLVRTDDGGVTWNMITPPGSGQLNPYFFVGIHQQDPRYVYAGDERSTDGGLTFAKVDFGAHQTAGNPFSMLAMSRTNSDVVYAVDRNQRRILRSNDRGDTWSLYANPGWRLSQSGPRTMLVVHPTNHDILFTQGPDGDLARFDGASWKPSHGILANAGGEALNNQVTSLAIDPNNPQVMYVNMYADGVPPVWGSNDGGLTWKNISDNMPYFGGNLLSVNPHTSELLMTSNMGTWIRRPEQPSARTPLWDNAAPRPQLGL